ncbi:DUF3979 family protein [Ectobacillus panaciterrae]|uniref:DUF3979 family protein n=1 Tax=Ectobacillus panaciterrae TaxID=363872 RepID=UPI00041457EE|nr:DUF3979 family protein [Ectobacillus panaciterrae]
MIHDTLQTFFKASPKQDQRNYFRYLLIEEDGKYAICESASESEDSAKSSISLSYNEENELKLVWHKGGRPIVTVQNIAVGKVAVTKDEDEESLQFVLERMPSRMVKVQLKPFFAVDLSMYWEVCEDCD